MIRRSANHRRIVSSFAAALPLAAAAALLGDGTLADEPRLRISSEGDLGGSAGAPGSGLGVAFGDAALRGRLDLARARLVEGRYEVPLEGGRRAILTLDPTLQARAEEVLDQAAAPYGAIVVLGLDGRVLALAAASRAEPHLGVADLALRPWAPAASIFKIVTSAALLDKGVAPETEVCFHGGVRSVEPSNLEDDPRRDGACETFAFGLSRSQNAIIAKLAHRHLDAATLRRYAEHFGFNAAPEFALPAAPPPAEIPEEPLERARAAAGFWHTELSPLSGALLAEVVATRGLAVTPRIVAAIVDASGEETPVLGVAPRRVLAPQVAETLARMMADTTERGTARSAFFDPAGRRYLGDVVAAGKTGSLSRKEPYLNYSWFVGFAPVDQPTHVVSVLLGNSATWRLKANTAARLVLETAITPRNSH